MRNVWLLRCVFAAMLLLRLLLADRAFRAASSEASVAAQVEIVRPAGTANGPGKKRGDASGVAIWLMPLETAGSAHSALAAKSSPQLVQRNKTFEPHVLIVRVGTVVAFPNKDPFFHNIFSLFDGKRFDLGLYASGTTRTVRFDRPGVSYLFCNIHAEMSAIVLAVETPYFALSGDSGSVAMADVPDGRYEMHVWYERSSAEDLNGLTHEVGIFETRRSLGRVRIIDNPNFTSAHQNKYGLDYVPPPNEGYSRR